MSEDELRHFLEEKVGRSEAVDALIKQLSAEGIQQFYLQHMKMVLPDAKAEEIASRNRAKFVEAVKMSKDGGIPWEWVKGQLG